MNPKWKGTLAIGAIGVAPNHINFGSLPSALALKRPCWIVTHDYINLNGQKMQSSYGEILDRIQRGTIVTMMLTHAGSLVLMVDKTNLEVFATGLPNHVYPVFDLYGKCERITILNVELRNGSPINEELPEFEGGVPQCEKADLEIHEKETEANFSLPSTSDDTRTRNRMSENFWTNMTIKSRSKNELSNSTSLRDSLELHHSTNLNIQRSQSTQRFDSNTCGVTASGTSVSSAAVPQSGMGGMSSSCNDSNYIDDGMCFADAAASAPGGDDEGQAAGALVDEAATAANQRTVVNMMLPLVATLESEMESLLLMAGEANDDLAAAAGIAEDDNSAAAEALSCSLTDFDAFAVTASDMDRDCDYFKLVCNFKKSLVLPDGFFVPDAASCFCDKCGGGGGNATGNGRLLNGWVRFRLNPETTNATNIVLDPDAKMLAFCTTTADRIRSILDNGELLPVLASSGGGGGGALKDDAGGTQLILSQSPNDNLKYKHLYAFR